MGILKVARRFHMLTSIEQDKDAGQEKVDEAHRAQHHHLDDHDHLWWDLLTLGCKVERDQPQ